MAKKAFDDITLKNKDILSLDQFNPRLLLSLFKITERMQRIVEKKQPSDLLKGSIVTLLFYEPSSRTFGSFASAVRRLGGTTIDIQNPTTTSSVAKGETLEDTIRTFETQSDAIVIRHPETGAAKNAAAAAKIPIINAGDGIGEHPTQALLDMYTIYQKFGRLDNLTGLFAGDMLHGRTVHSLLKGLSIYKKNTMYLLSPKQLRLSRDDFSFYEKRGLKLIEISSEKKIPKDANFWYWTRIQKERFSSTREYEKVKKSFIITPQFMKKYASKNMILMHPLPRINEITIDVDYDPRSVYFTNQIRSGVYVRMALLAVILGKI